MAKEARKWYDEHSANLDFPKKRMISHFKGMTDSALVWGNGRDDGDLGRQLDDAHKSIHERINWLLQFGGEMEELKVDDR